MEKGIFYKWKKSYPVSQPSFPRLSVRHEVRLLATTLHIGSIFLPRLHSLWPLLSSRPPSLDTSSEEKAVCRVLCPLSKAALNVFLLIANWCPTNINPQPPALSVVRLYYLYKSRTTVERSKNETLKHSHNFEAGIATG